MSHNSSLTNLLKGSLDSAISNSNEKNTVNQNLLSHAKKKAKKLLSLSKDNNFIIEIKNLSEAQQIIAKINGFENWHILEQAAKQNAPQHDIKTMIDNTLDNTVYLDKFKRKNNFIKEEKTIPHLIDEKTNSVYSFLQIEYLGHTQYESISDIIFYSYHSIKMMLDREFSKIEMDLFYLEDKHTKSTVYDPIDEKVNTVLLDENVLKLLQLKNFETSSMTSDEYGLSIILTVKTSMFAQNEHFKLIKDLQQSLPESLKYQFISDHQSFKKYHELTQYKEKYSLNILEKDDINNKTISESTLKYLHNLNKINIAWSWHLDESVSQITIYCDDEKEKNNRAYLLNGYKKEINKNLYDNLLYSIKHEAFNFKITPLDNDKINVKPGIRQTHIDVILGKPGSGKTMFAQKSILKNVLEYTNKNNTLPEIGVITLGSYDGVLNVLRSMVKTDERELINEYTLEMTPTYSVNVFDTSLGCRYPTHQQVAYLTNFITLLITDVADESIIGGMQGMVSSIIQEMYATYSDTQDPKLYNKSVNEQVDEALLGLDISVDNKTTWWEVVDILMQADKQEQAKLAQRHAMPLLSDTLNIAQSTKIRDIYSRLTVSRGETLVGYFIRVIMETLNQYPILVKPTSFSVEGNKIISLNLEKVSPSGSLAGNHQSAVMYMLAKYLLSTAFHGFTDNQFNIKDFNPTLNKSYLKYYEDLFNKRKTLSTYLYFDEFHRVIDKKALKEQFIIEIRESRIWDRHITMLSQDDKLINDGVINSFVSSLYIMGISTYDSNTIKELQRLTSSNIIHLARSSEQLKHAIYHFIITLSGKHEYFLNNKNSKELIWATNTTTGCIRLREKLVSHFGLVKAISLLVKYYPTCALPHEDVEGIFQKIKQQES